MTQQDVIVFVNAVLAALGVKAYDIDAGESDEYTVVWGAKLPNYKGSGWYDGHPALVIFNPENGRVRVDFNDMAKREYTTLTEDATLEQLSDILTRHKHLFSAK
jgi:hypothetical protein